MSKIPRPLSAEDEATSISNAIDDELKREYMRRNTLAKREVKVMLLGQAESGKSTLRKQFQLCYASDSLDAEKPRWRAVIFFNVIKAVRRILEELDDIIPPPAQNIFCTSPPSADKLIVAVAQAQILDHRRKLLPLVVLEDSLALELNGGVAVSDGKKDISVRAGWQNTMTQTWTKVSRRESSNNRPITPLVWRIIVEVQDSIAALWHHSDVISLMESGQLQLGEWDAFFLDSIERLAQPDYLPSTDDVLKVRLETSGITECSFNVSLHGKKCNWLLYDVGGSKTQRHSWAPYFDDATTIIFLAPISTIDQYLEEDPKIHRINDSLQIFSSICENKLLKRASLVLLLNKTDILKRKLEAGIEVRKYVTSYGHRPNTYEAVSSYFRAHFVHTHRQKDIAQRPLFVHFTSMLDTRATQTIIADVGHSIFQQHLVRTSLA